MIRPAAQIAFAGLVLGRVRPLAELRHRPRARISLGRGFLRAFGGAQLISQNASGTEPATFLAVFVAEEGARVDDGGAMTRSSDPRKGGPSTALSTRCVRRVRAVRANTPPRR